MDTIADWISKDDRIKELESQLRLERNKNIRTKVEAKNKKESSKRLATIMIKRCKLNNLKIPRNDLVEMYGLTRITIDNLLYKISCNEL